MDFLKKNVFAGVCAGVALAALGIFATVYFSIDVGAAKKKVEQLKSAIEQAGVVYSKADIEALKSAATQRQNNLLDVERTFVDGRVLQPQDSAIYVAYWGSQNAMVTIDRAARRATISSGIPSGENQRRLDALDTSVAFGLPVAGLALVDPDASDANWNTWKRNNDSELKGKSAALVRLLSTLHGNVFPRGDAVVAEAFRNLYRNWPNKVREQLGAAPELDAKDTKDSKLLDRLRAQYHQWREEQAVNIREIELHRRNLTLIQSGKRELQEKGEYRKSLFALVGPEVTPADMLRRAVARTGHTYWADNCLYLEPWASGDIKVIPSPEQMFAAQVKVFITEDVIRTINEVNHPPVRTADGRVAPEPPSTKALAEMRFDWVTEDKRAEYDALMAELAAAKDDSARTAVLTKLDTVRERLSWEDWKKRVVKGLDDAAKAANDRKQAANDKSGPRSAPVTGGTLGPEPKLLTEPEVFTNIRAVLGNVTPVPGNNSVVWPYNWEPRQGVLGSDIKVLLQIPFWVATLPGVDAEWPFLSATEPLMIGGPPAPKAAAAPEGGSPPTADAKAKADSGEADVKTPAAPIAAFRTLPRPKPEEIAAYRNTKTDSQKNAPKASTPQLLGREVPISGLTSFGSPNLSFTARGSTNDYLVMHFAVRFIGTPRGVDQFIRIMENRRFYTLALPPMIYSISPVAYRGLDFGPDPIVEATLYFEGVLYYHTFRRVLTAAETGGPEVLVNLIPQPLWDKFNDSARLITKAAVGEVPAQ